MFRVFSERTANGVLVRWEADATMGELYESALRFLGNERPDRRRELLEAIAEVVRKGLERTFDTGGVHVGWAKPTLSTLLSKRVRGYGGNVLIESGLLKSSYTEKGAEGHTENFGYNSLQIGSYLWYARYHQEGTHPHLIEARRSAFLRFLGADGEWKYRRYVHHPGHPARPVDLDNETLAEIQVLLSEFFVKFLEEEEGTS